MEFGRAENLEGLDLTLPDDHPDTEKIFKKTKKKPVVYAGCAKWGIPEWVGVLYPKGTKPGDFRENYLKQFNCIELNPTHYKIERSTTIVEWKKGADKSFRFCPKFHQGISHFKRLKNAGELTELFFKSVSNLGENLGVCFLQMPPNFGPKNMEVLSDYLSSLPTKPEVCIELRHPDWYKSKEVFDETYMILKKNKVGFAITDVAGRRDLLHMRLSTRTAFIRFVGNSLHPTDFERVDDWIDRIKRWYESGIEKIYFLMHMHDERYSPELCAYAIRKLNKECNLKLNEPVFYTDN